MTPNIKNLNAPSAPAQEKKRAGTQPIQVFSDIVIQREESKYFKQLQDSPELAGNILLSLVIDKLRPLNNFYLYFLPENQIGPIESPIYNSALVQDIRRVAKQELQKLQKIPNLRERFTQFNDLKLTSITAEDNIFAGLYMQAFLKTLAIKNDDGSYKYTFGELRA